MLKGVVVDIEAEEMEEEAVDSSVGVVGKKIMRNRSHAEALPIFYLARKWKETRQARWRWRRVHTLSKLMTVINVIFFH